MKPAAGEGRLCWVPREVRWGDGSPAPPPPSLGPVLPQRPGSCLLHGGPVAAAAACGPGSWPGGLPSSGDPRPTYPRPSQKPQRLALVLPGQWEPPRQRLWQIPEAPRHWWSPRDSKCPGVRVCPPPLPPSPRVSEGAGAGPGSRRARATEPGGSPALRGALTWGSPRASLGGGMHSPGKERWVRGQVTGDGAKAQSRARSPGPDLTGFRPWPFPTSRRQQEGHRRGCRRGQDKGHNPSGATCPLHEPGEARHPLSPGSPSGR